MKPKIVVDFSKTIREWDGFGVTYVEAAQTRDYCANPQDYGGFGCLAEADRLTIINMIFGDDGLKPGLIKMFLDPFHQAMPGASYDFDPYVIDMNSYDHETTTRWMRYFVREGLKRTSASERVKIIATLYGPPGWMTRQRFVRGRDLDPQYKYEAAKYLISWAKYLRETERFPVKYLSLHNEGEDWLRWPLDGREAGDANHDYNLYWPPEQVVDFLRFMPDLLRAQGMQDVGVTPGETSGWYRFDAWGYADAIAENPQAIQNLGLITSHGFFNGDQTGEWFGDWRSAGIDKLRAQRPALHAWVTSTSWSKMDVFFINELRNHIYSAKVNAIIPWAVIQLQGNWEGGDPNPGTAFRVWEDGRYEVAPGYYFYKQVCRAGQPGMAVCQAWANDRKTGLIAFGSNGTDNPDAFVVLNMWSHEQPLDIEVRGSSSQLFEGHRTSATEQYAAIGRCKSNNGLLAYTAPPLSVTTFSAVGHVID